jgi:dephospho-CoA kinase
VKVFGLTGSIGMGKSTAAKFLRRLNIPVHDADQAVHGFLRAGGAAVAVLAKIFPEAVRGGDKGPYIDRKALGQVIFADPAQRIRLESIIHPLVRQSEENFLRRQARRRRPIVVLDIPLLFETGAERRCDATMAVVCSDYLQAQRVLRRPGMTAKLLSEIRAAQISAQKKRRMADVVIPTGRALGYSLRAVRRALQKLRQKPARKGPRRRFGFGKKTASSDDGHYRG